MKIEEQELIKNITHGIFATDMQGEVVFWNKAGERVFGFSEEEILGKPVHLFYSHEDREQFVKDIEKLKEGKKEVAGQWKARKKDGSVAWVDMHLRLIKDDEGNFRGTVGSACDIGDKVKAEKRLEESRARAQAIIDNTVEGIITINETGAIETFNKAAEEIFGYKEEEVVGKNVSILMPSPYDENHDRYIQRYLETGEKKIIGIGREVTGQRKDGSVFPMDLAVSEVRFNDERIFTGIVKDISDRRRLEHEVLQISEEERRRIGQDLHDGLGQMLTGLGLISQNIAKKLKAREIPEAEEVQEVADMIKEADEQARGLARGLVHVDLESNGLKAALLRSCKQAKRLFGLDCLLEEEGQTDIENRLISLNLYRIAQEAISNAAKHGNASKVRLMLKRIDNFIKLIIEDNGSGFSDESNVQKEKGMGINIMHYRANLLGGQLEINETGDGKTQVACMVPAESESNLIQTEAYTDGK